MKNRVLFVDHVLEHLRPTSPRQRFGVPRPRVLSSQNLHVLASPNPAIPESPLPLVPIPLLVTTCHGTIRREPSSNQIEPGGTTSSTQVRRWSSYWTRHPGCHEGCTEVRIKFALMQVTVTVHDLAIPSILARVSKLNEGLSFDILLIVRRKLFYIFYHNNARWVVKRRCAYKYWVKDYLIYNFNEKRNSCWIRGILLFNICLISIRSLVSDGATNISLLNIERSQYD